MCGPQEETVAVQPVIHEVSKKTKQKVNKKVQFLDSMCHPHSEVVSCHTPSRQPTGAWSLSGCVLQYPVCCGSSSTMQVRPVWQCSLLNVGTARHKLMWISYIITVYTPCTDPYDCQHHLEIRQRSSMFYIPWDCADETWWGKFLCWVSVRYTDL